MRFCMMTMNELKYFWYNLINIDVNLIITYFFILLGVNVGYVENSYSNSNNGGSVNSQDSLWQLKMGGNGSTGGTHISRDDNLHMSERMNHYGN